MRQAWPAHPEVPISKAVRAGIEATMKKIPIVSGEWGYSCAEGSYIDDKTQGQYLARQWLTNISNGVPLSMKRSPIRANHACQAAWISGTGSH